MKQNKNENKHYIVRRNTNAIKVHQSIIPNTNEFSAT